MIQGPNNKTQSMLRQSADAKIQPVKKVEYEKPTLKRLGHLAQVTKKTGASSDVGHPTMP